MDGRQQPVHQVRTFGTEALAQQISRASPPRQRDGGGRERLPCNEGKGQAVECSCDPAADGEYTKQHDNRGGDAHAGTSSVSPAQRRCRVWRSEEHTSELQSLMRISYAVFCLKKKKYHNR